MLQEKVNQFVDVGWLSREHVGTWNFKTLLRALSFVGDFAADPVGPSLKTVPRYFTGMWPTLLIVVTLFWLINTCTLNTCAYKAALHILLCLGGCILTYRVGLFSTKTLENKPTPLFE